MSDDAKFETGAVRSADTDHFDFASLPLLALLGLGRVAGVGGEKYGRFNYMLGMPVHNTINHSVLHVILDALGDRSEPHLLKAAWGLLVAEQTRILNPERDEAHLLGPGATMPQAMIDLLKSGAYEKECLRKAGSYKEMEAWTLGDLPAVKEILKARAEAEEQDFYEKLNVFNGVPSEV